MLIIYDGSLSDVLAAKERGSVPTDSLFPEAEGKLVEEVTGLGRYGKTLTVSTVEGMIGTSRKACA